MQKKHKWSFIILSIALVCYVILPSNEAKSGPKIPDNRAQVCIYVVDVGLGKAVFVVAPSGEVMLLDTGRPSNIKRTLAFMEQNGIRKIDYLIVSHFEDDHMGAAPMIIEKIPVGCFVDHGDSVVYGKSDAWWKQHRQLWSPPGVGQKYDKSFDEYRMARAKARRHLVVKHGDRLPVEGLDVVVVSAAGKVITQPLKGCGAVNPACKGIDRRADAGTENAQSVGVVMCYGKFRFVDLGDLTWNTANKLFCPNNLVGKADAYMVTHHALSYTREYGDYHWGESACSAAEVYGLHPRVAILSLGTGGHTYGTSEAMKLLNGVPGLDLWQTQFVSEGGEKGYNGPEAFIANLGEKSDKVPYIKLAASTDGSFRVTNSRNGFIKKYPPRK